MLMTDPSSACIASAFTLYYRVQVSQNHDLTWTLAILFRWVSVYILSNLGDY